MQGDDVRLKPAVLAYTYVALLLNFSTCLVSSIHGLHAG